MGDIKSGAGARHNWTMVSAMRWQENEVNTGMQFSREAMCESGPER